MKNILKHIEKDSILFLILGFLYVLIELLWRGYSSIWMALVGGIAGIMIGHINSYLSWETPLWKQMIIGMVIIDGLELIFGYVLNIRMGLAIWDYSNLPLGNLWGQVSTIYSVLWFFLSGVGIFTDDWLRHILFKERKPMYVWF